MIFDNRHGVGLTSFPEALALVASRLFIGSISKGGNGSKPEIRT